ncbi:MAG TPA: GAF domain-containing protein [Pseudonocardia sp.]|nr:GAF domain-containing protein [Pseudonocardia sp.]
MDNVACAVHRGVDLRRHALLLQRTHEAMLTGHALPAAPRAVVARSWRRMRADGHDPDHGSGGRPVAVEVLERRRRASPLGGVLPGLRASLASIADEAQHIMVVTDADGVVLWRDGCARVRRRADALGFTDGAAWTETAVGTNAIGTALVERAAVQLFSAEHYERSLHPWTCAAAPVHDPRTGELLGIVDISGPAATVHPAAVALVGTAVRLAEAQLWQRGKARLDALREVAGSVLGRVRGPAAVVDEDGWVAAVSGVDGIDRVPAPVAGQRCVVAEIGCCLPEPVPGGWLLRRPETADAPLRLRLDLRSRPPQAVLEGDGVWRHRLTPRQAQLLVLLMRAGPAGLDAFALSAAVFGDREHAVTVRAEVSRLRRRMGGVLLARPYRIAPNIDLVTG